MKKPLIIGLLLVLILGGAFGIYKYFFEELVDYYTIIYIPPYEKEEESNYDDLMCGVGLSSYSEPKITVERDWYPNKSDTDDKALSGEERKFKDRKNSLERITDSKWLNSHMKPKDDFERQVMQEASSNLAQEIILEQRWLVSIRYKRYKTPEDIGKELKQHAKEIFSGQYQMSEDFNLKVYQLKGF
jgi:hypothetical protein